MAKYRILLASPLSDLDVIERVAEVAKELDRKVARPKASINHKLPASKTMFFKKAKKASAGKNKWAKK